MKDRGVLKSFDGVSEGIGFVGDERVKGVPEARLSDHFERGADHPSEHVELDRIIFPPDT